MRTVAHALISYTQGAYEPFCRDGITQFKILCYILLRIMIDYIAVRIFLMTGIRYKKSWSKVWHVQNLEKRKDNYRIIRQESLIVFTCNALCPRQLIALTVTVDIGAGSSATASPPNGSPFTTRKKVLSHN